MVAVENSYKGDALMWGRGASLRSTLRRPRPRFNPAASLTPTPHRHASDRLRNDFDVVMAAVTRTGFALKNASPTLKDNAEIVKVAVMQEGRALEHASERLRDNEDMVRAAVAEVSYSLEYASKRLQDDKEFCGTLKPGSARGVDPMPPTRNDPPVSLEIAPPAFDVTVFTLKAAATMLVSTMGMCIHLLRYYRGDRWSDVASSFIGGLSIPNLSLTLQFTFTWPTMPGLKVSGLERLPRHQHPHFVSNSSASSCARSTSKKHARSYMTRVTPHPLPPSPPTPRSHSRWPSVLS